MERSFADAAQRQGLEYTIIGGVDAQPPANLVPRVVKRLVHGSGYASDPIEWSKRLRGREARELCDAVLSALDQVPGLEPERTTFFLYHGHPLHIPALIRLGLALSGRSPIVLNLYHLHHIYMACIARNAFPAFENSCNTLASFVELQMFTCSSTVKVWGR